MSAPLASMYRMPVTFGPAPGPRNLPEDRRSRRYEKRTSTLILSAATDRALLGRLLPAPFSVAGDPRIEIVLMVLKDVGWLAGRGYNIVMVRIPASYRGAEERGGAFVPVLWESLADPILTGREELGWPKIFAEIPDPLIADGTWRAEARWDGFAFLDIAASGLVAVDAESLPPSRALMFHKYMPRTGAWGEAEVDYFTTTEPDGPAPRVTSVSRGSGSFSFTPARWEDMPTQYPIVNALAALPLGDFGPAFLVASSGGGDASGQRRLR